MVDDRVDEDAKTIRLRASASGYGAATCSITLNDNDTAGLVVNAASLTIGEKMDKEYEVKLNSKPTDQVTVTVSEESDKIGAAATLTFTTRNWDTNQTVTVNAEDDGDCANESATVKNESTSSDSDYQELSEDVAVTVIDDESPTITLSSSSSSVSEPSGSAKITATLGCTSTSKKTIELDPTGTADNDDYTVGTLEVKVGKLTGEATLTVNDTTWPRAPRLSR